MPLNDAACGQAPAKAKRIRVAVLVTQAAILSRFFLAAKARFRRCEKLTTIRQNMNHTLGGDEQQVLLPSGMPIRLLGMRIGRGSLPMTSKSRTT